MEAYCRLCQDRKSAICELPTLRERGHGVLNLLMAGSGDAVFEGGGLLGCVPVQPSTGEATAQVKKDFSMIRQRVSDCIATHMNLELDRLD